MRAAGLDFLNSLDAASRLSPPAAVPANPGFLDNDFIEERGGDLTAMPDQVVTAISRDPEHPNNSPFPHQGSKAQGRCKGSRIMAIVQQ